MMADENETGQIFGSCVSVTVEKMATLLLLNELMISTCEASTPHLPTENTKMTEKRKTNVQNIKMYIQMHT